MCLVTDNLHLIEYILKRTNIPIHWDIEEFRECGEDALIRAAKIFDESKGYKFKTLACLCIQRAMWQSTKKESRFNNRNSM